MNGAAKKLRNAKIHIPDNFEIAPLTENNFAKKPLAERGGTPPPLTENCRKFSSTNGAKRAKLGVFWPKIAVF